MADIATGDIYVTHLGEYLWALDCKPLVPDGLSLPVLAHLIVRVERDSFGEIRHGACGRIFTSGNHPRGWWSTRPGRLPLSGGRDIHCGGDIAKASTPG